MAGAAAQELGRVESGAAHDGRALALAVLVCGALAGLAPLHLALLAPLLLGAPHVLEDLRAFVLRPPRPVERRALRWIGALLLLLTLARAQALAGGLALPRVELLCGLLALVAARCTRVDARRGLPLALLGLALLIGLCMARPRAAALFVAHAHNLVALYLWSSWSRGLAWRRVGKDS